VTVGGRGGGGLLRDSHSLDSDAYDINRKKKKIKKKGGEKKKLIQLLSGKRLVKRKEKKKGRREKADNTHFHQSYLLNGDIEWRGGGRGANFIYLFF